jgi:hypothetical protein
MQSFRAIGNLVYVYPPIQLVAIVVDLPMETSMKGRCIVGILM